MSIEAFVRNSREDNYAQSLKRMRTAAADCDFRTSAAKLHLPERDGYVFMMLLGTSYRLCLSSGMVERENADGSFSAAGYHASMIFYDILSFAPENLTASGEYVSLPSLSAVKNASGYAGADLLVQTAQFWQQHTAEIAAAIKRLGGKPFGKGDIRALVPLFFDIQMAVSFWNSDEDFPPMLTLLFDRTILQYMHYETVWYLAVLFSDTCRELIQKPF